MLEFLMLLSARFHGEIFCVGADLAREAQSDPTINVEREVFYLRELLEVVMRYDGLVEHAGVLVSALAPVRTCSHWPCTCEAWTV